MSVRDYISKIAHKLYVLKGMKHGNDLDDWLEAEEMIRGVQSENNIKVEICKLQLQKFEKSREIEWKMNALFWTAILASAKFICQKNF